MNIVVEDAAEKCGHAAPPEEGTIGSLENETPAAPAAHQISSPQSAGFIDVIAEIRRV